MGGKDSDGVNWLHWKWRWKIKADLIFELTPYLEGIVGSGERFTNWVISIGIENREEIQGIKTAELRNFPQDPELMRSYLSQITCMYILSEQIHESCWLLSASLITIKNIAVTIICYLFFSCHRINSQLPQTLIDLKRVLLILR